MSRDAILRSAREGFGLAGRGVLLIHDNPDDERYSTIDELRVVLAEAPELAGIIEIACAAVASYDPEQEAVVLESRDDAVSVVLVRIADVVTLGSLVFVDPT